MCLMQANWAFPFCLTALRIIMSHFCWRRTTVSHANIYHIPIAALSFEWSEASAARCKWGLSLFWDVTQRRLVVSYVNRTAYRHSIQRSCTIWSLNTVPVFYVLLTVHLGSILVNNHLDAQFFFRIYLFQFSTCFENPCAHHQENQMYQYDIWYMSLCKWPSSVRVWMELGFPETSGTTIKSAKHPRRAKTSTVIWFDT